MLCSFGQNYEDSSDVRTDIKAYLTIQKVENDVRLCDSNITVLRNDLRVSDQQLSITKQACTEVIADHIKIEANDQKEIGSLKKQNSKLQKANYIFKAATIVLATTVYVMALKR